MTTPATPPAAHTAPSRSAGRSPRRILAALLTLALATALGGVAGAVLRSLMPPEYTSTTLVNVYALDNQNPAAVQIATVQWASTIEAMARSHEVELLARQGMDEFADFDSSQVSVSQTERSPIIAIRGTAGTKAEASAISTGIHQGLQRRLAIMKTRDVAGVDIMNLSSASEAKDSRPSAIMVAGVGALVGFLVALAALRLLPGRFGLWVFH